MTKLSLEQIFYQTKDPFKDDLTRLVDEILHLIDDGKLKSNLEVLTVSGYGTKLIKLIKNRFNVTVVMDDKLSNYIPAAVIPFSSDYLLSVKSVNRFSSNFISELFGGTNIFSHLKKLEKERTDVYKRVHGRTGFVDFKSARVGGYLADVRHFLIINFFTLRDRGLTSDEIAAVITHEIGHIFDGLSSHYKMTTNNSAIMDTLNLLNENKIEKAIYTFKTRFGPEELEEAKLSKDSKVTDFYGPVARQYMTDITKQFKNTKYNQTNYEAMADSFAVRLGFTDSLIKALDKVYTDSGISPYNSVKFFYVNYVVESMMYAFLLLFCGIPGAILTVLFFSLFAGSNHKDMTYDVPYDRYNRIRNGVIGHLKNPQLPKEFTEELLNQLTYIDSVMANAKNFKSLSDIVADIIKPSARETVKYIEIQQTIENSLNNNLFQKSAQLRVF